MPSPLALPGRGRQSGVALLVVLAALVLATVLIIALLSSSKTERISSDAHLRKAEINFLSASVKSLVESQILEATGDSGRAWTTQPGAIRTFTASRQPGPVFKLYSARELVVPGEDFDPEVLQDVPTGETLDSNVFTDLNTPVWAQGRWNYPILNPVAIGKVEGFALSPEVKNVAVDQLKVADGDPIPDIIPMPVRWIYVTSGGDFASVGDDGVIDYDPNAYGGNNRIVGRIAFWVDDETSKLNVNTASSGMFWDLPRGSGNDFERGSITGAKHALPQVSLSGLAASQPGNEEFQRFPGHPATTSLDVVLDNDLFFPGLAAANPAVRKEQIRRKILEITPRFGWGGSQYGTQFPLSDNVADAGSDRLYSSVDEVFFKHASDPNVERPKASTAEGSVPAAELSPQNIDLSRFFLTAHSRSPEVTQFNTPRMTIWPVDVKVENRTVFDSLIAFCSTIGGREYVFTRNPFDHRRFSFTGAPTSVVVNGGAQVGSQSKTLDFNANNQELYRYLQNLMSRPFPGYGASLQDKFEADSDQLLTQIFDYIRSTNLYDTSAADSKPFTGRAILGAEGDIYSPGFGSGDGLFWPLPHPSDPSLLSPPRTVNNSVPSLYSAQVVPLEVNGTRGFGRFPTITSAALVFFAEEPRDPNMRFKQPYPDPGNPTAPGVQRDPVFVPWDLTLNDIKQLPAGIVEGQNLFPGGQIRAFLVLALGLPSPGYLSYHHAYDMRVTGLQNIRISVDGQEYNPGFTPEGVNRIFAHRWQRGPFGIPDWQSTFSGLRAVGRGYAFPPPGGGGQVYLLPRAKSQITPSTGLNSEVYPFVSVTPVIIPANSTASNMRVSGAENLRASLELDGQTLQTFTLNFPEFEAPIPRWAPLASNAVSWTARLDRFGNRLSVSEDNGGLRFHAPFKGAPGRIFQLLAPILPNELDTVRGIEMSTNSAPFGDMRLVAGLTDVPVTYFSPVNGYDNPSVAQAHNLAQHPQSSFGRLSSQATGAIAQAQNFTLGLPSSLDGAKRSDGEPGDWDMGVTNPIRGGYPRVDVGAYINKSDDAAANYRERWTGNPLTPYFEVEDTIVAATLPFTPNRMIPSAVVFGSLPVGVKRQLPWQTLLFRPPIPAHPGAAGPVPDHLLLDLFQMPVVQPYAISEPFSTAGKVNLNFQIAPFGYIERSTALRGVLYPDRITAVPGANAYMAVQNAAGSSSDGNGKSTNYRYPIDRDATITLFKDRFTQKKPFITASELTEMPLVPLPENLSRQGIQPASVTPHQTSAPAGGSASQVRAFVENFWNTAGSGTADNLRERPYASIYPRVTTKSNTFQIHMKVQVIQKTLNTDPRRMEAADRVVAEYQGAQTIERFLDPKATFDPSDTNAALGPYQFRTISDVEFRP